MVVQPNKRGAVQNRTAFLTRNKLTLDQLDTPVSLRLHKSGRGECGGGAGETALPQGLFPRTSPLPYFNDDCEKVTVRRIIARLFSEVGGLNLKESKLYDN